MMKRFLSVFLSLGILLAGCQEKDGPVKEAVPAPKVIS
jgi:PBP1b-binding outer membrane lipoprotein LpoB